MYLAMWATAGAPRALPLLHVPLFDGLLLSPEPVYLDAPGVELAVAVDGSVLVACAPCRGATALAVVVFDLGSVLGSELPARGALDLAAAVAVVCHVAPRHVEIVVSPTARIVAFVADDAVSVATWPTARGGVLVDTAWSLTTVMARVAANVPDLQTRTMARSAWRVLGFDPEAGTMFLALALDAIGSVGARPRRVVYVALLAVSATALAPLQLVRHTRPVSADTAGLDHVLDLVPRYLKAIGAVPAELERACPEMRVWPASARIPHAPRVVVAHPVYPSVGISVSTAV